MNKKHTMPSYLVELEHELSAALIKVDDQRELLRLAKEENEEKRKDIVWTMGERAKLMDRIKQLISERDTAQMQSDQKVSLREEFRELLGTDDIEQGVAVVREMKNRIQRLEQLGDALANVIDENCDPTFANDVTRWRKNKEAKP